MFTKCAIAVVVAAFVGTLSVGTDAWAQVAVAEEKLTA